MELLRKLLKLIKFAAQYEILWLPLPFPHFSTISRILKTIDGYRGICLFQRAMIRSIQLYIKHNKGQPFQIPKDFEDFLDEFNIEVSKLGDFHILGNPFYCKYDNNIKVHWDSFSEKFNTMAHEFFGQVDFSIVEGSSKPSKFISIGFPSYFFFCMRGMCDNIINIEKLRKLPKNRILGVSFLFLQIGLFIYLVGF